MFGLSISIRLCIAVPITRTCIVHSILRAFRYLAGSDSEVQSSVNCKVKKEKCNIINFIIQKF